MGYVFVILAVVAASVPLVFLFLLWKYSYWYRQGVPQGNPLKLFGAMNDISITSYETWDIYLTLGKKFPGKPVFGIYSMAKPRLIVRDPEMIRDILVRKFSSFAENGFDLDEEMEPILSRDPFFQKNGEKWKTTRAHFSSIMTPSRLRNMMPEMLEASKEALAYLRDLKQESGRGDGVNMKDVSLRYMTEAIVRLTFSVDPRCFKQKRNAFLDTANEIFSESFNSLLIMLCFMVVPRMAAYLGLSFVKKDVITFFEGVIKQQKEYRKSNNITRNDILDFVTRKVNDTKSNENANGTSKPDVAAAEKARLDVLAMAIMFFMEGFETTSTATTVTAAEVARHPELQETLRREILTACPRGTVITEEAINNIPLLHNCFLESLRMCPPAMFLQRIAAETVTLQSKMGEDVEIKEGTYINLPIASFQRDPENFPDPEKFDPYRFEDNDQKRLLLGFGDGPRQCPGQKFALLTSKVLLASILREFSLELSPKTKVPLHPLNNPLLFSVKEVMLRCVPL